MMSMWLLIMTMITILLEAVAIFVLVLVIKGQGSLLTKSADYAIGDGDPPGGAATDDSAAASSHVFITSRSVVVHNSRECASIKGSSKVKALAFCQKCANHLAIAAETERKSK